MSNTRIEERRKKKNISIKSNHPQNLTLVTSPITEIGIFLGRSWLWGILAGVQLQILLKMQKLGTSPKSMNQNIEFIGLE